jgi:hypothetical protein
MISQYSPGSKNTALPSKRPDNVVFAYLTLKADKIEAKEGQDQEHSSSLHREDLENDHLFT